jgi:tetratricopeptide (TPR) repeat protein
MAEIVYNGKTYTRNNSKWIDRDHMVVHKALQQELNKLYLKTLDLTSYSLKDLISEGDKFKDSYTYDYAIAFYEKTVELCDEETLKYILPRITSCYRHEKRPKKAIELFSYAKGKYGEYFITPVLLTSVAAAYCDLKEYENALRCCRWAFKRYGGDIDPNLSSVFDRIKKESGIE